MDYSINIDRKLTTTLTRAQMIIWLLDNVEGKFEWKHKQDVHSINFKFEGDLLVFRLRWCM